jgi:hypothetical protein
VRIAGPHLVVAILGFMVVLTSGCEDELPQPDYPAADVPVTERDDDAWPILDTRTDVEGDTPPRAPKAAVSEAEWSERFAEAQRAKRARVVGLREAVDRCYRTLREPKNGGSTKLARAICFGGVPPIAAPSASAMPVAHPRPGRP